MGVYIKGMEMPTRCADCEMYVEDIYCCHLLHREIENPWADDGVELDCPLGEIPPHGRLIDADAVMEKLQKQRWNYQMLDDSQTADKIMHGLFRAEQIINDAPTIIEARRNEHEP